MCVWGGGGVRVAVPVRVVRLVNYSILYSTAYLILAGESKVFDLHLPPAPSWEEDLFNTRTVYTVHHCNCSPVSANPNMVTPNCKTGAGCVGVISRHGYLHLYVPCLCMVLCVLCVCMYVMHGICVCYTWYVCVRLRKMCAYVSMCMC